MFFSNELNYWVIKKNAKKDLLLRMRAPYQNLSRNRDRILQFNLFDKVNQINPKDVFLFWVSGRFKIDHENIRIVNR
ncbi:hypothetical protein [Leptospira borgpetersenii]|uniref:hypothetical protein n=1 Tax=Leptospira borgpetersenii TaxID=174 RepID=UPI001D13C899|nr:hypothetical protein [Leptospira borgpetersenii]